jgi:hypothetical protein
MTTAVLLVRSSSEWVMLIRDIVDGEGAARIGRLEVRHISAAWVPVDTA